MLFAEVGFRSLRPQHTSRRAPSMQHSQPRHIEVNKVPCAHGFQTKKEKEVAIHAVIQLWRSLVTRCVLVCVRVGHGLPCNGL